MSETMHQCSHGSNKEADVARSHRYIHGGLETIPTGQHTEPRQLPGALYHRALPMVTYRMYWPAICGALVQAAAELAGD